MSNNKIMVVDDDKNICELLQIYLQKRVLVTTISSGEEAIEVFLS